MRVVNKLRGMISLAAKAGKVVSGDTAVAAAVQKKEAHLLLAEKNASANTMDKMGKLKTAYELELLLIEDLGACIGKPGRTMVAITDEGFAKAICKKYDECNDTGV